MAKFNIEVELDWVDVEDGYTIDEEIKEQVVSGIKDALLKKATTEAVEAVDDKIAEKILEAEGTISFENSTMPDIARYEENDEGGTFYPGDDEKPYSSYGIFVNAWMPLPEPYKGE